MVRPPSGSPSANTGQLLVLHLGEPNRAPHHTQHHPRPHLEGGIGSRERDHHHQHAEQEGSVSTVKDTPPEQRAEQTAQAMADVIIQATVGTARLRPTPPPDDF